MKFSMQFWQVIKSAFVLTFLFLAFAVKAQHKWPERPVKLIVPFPVAGPADAIARAVAERLTQKLGQPFIVENRPGGGGDTATALVAKAAPDGYTLILGAGATLAVSPALSRQMQYDSVRDFSPIAMLASAPNILVVNESIKANTLKEFIALAKTRQDGYSFASGGKGSSGHMSAELLRSVSGMPFVHVPYKGQAQALTDMVGGHVPAMFATLTGTREFVASGKLRALAITSPARSQLAPEIPTISESGYPGYQNSSWWGILAPSGTSAVIVKLLNLEITSILSDPEFRKTLAIYGIEPFPMTSDQFSEFLRSEIERAAKLVQSAGIPKE